MARNAWIVELLRLVDEGATFHITDTETTGSGGAEARVIELATVSVCRGEIVGRFETLIDPGVAVPPWITQLTGIDTAMLQGAPSPEAALAAWHGYLGESGQFVAHNAPFDWGCLRAEYARLERDWPFAQKFCTVQMARRCLPELKSRSLESLIAHYQIEVDARHRALADAEATAVVFNRLIPVLRQVIEVPPKKKRTAKPEQLMIFKQPV